MNRCLTEEGYRVLRLWNNDVLGNLDGVLMIIQSELASSNEEPPRS
jgi:very-short-patch-repair endonuclease